MGAGCAGYKPIKASQEKKTDIVVEDPEALYNHSYRACWLVTLFQMDAHIRKSSFSSWGLNNQEGGRACVVVESESMEGSVITAENRPPEKQSYRDHHRR